MTPALVLLAVVGCSQPVVESAAPVDPVVSTWVTGVGGAGGALTAQVVGPQTVQVTLGEPVATGLEFTAEQAPRVELAGSQRITTQIWRFTGSKGSYRIEGPQVSWESEGLATPSPLYIDLGVQAPREGELVDITDPDQVQPFPVGAVAVGVGVAGLLVGGIWFAFRPRRTPQAPAPLSADVIALREWKLARDNAELDEHGKALAISAIFRTYVEAVVAIPATAWTTSEIVAHLGGMPLMSDSNVPRAKRLLRATDRVKFADAAASEELFDELDTDLKAFVKSTRTRRMGEVTS